MNAKALARAAVLITIIVPLLTIIGGYAIYGYRIEQVEIRLTADEQAQAAKDDRLQTWEQAISTKVATTDANVEWLVKREQTK